MKCESCKTECEPNVCFPRLDDHPGAIPGDGWKVHYCPNTGCILGYHQVPQVPRRKAVDSLEVNSRKPSPVRAALEREAAR